MAGTAPERTVAPLSLCLFGPFEVHVNGRPLPRLRSRKGYWLLALLTLRNGAEVDRAWLAGTLWPDASEFHAASSLRNSLKDLRHALGPEAARLRSPASRTLALNLESASVDVCAFDAAIAEGALSSLEQAIALYRGPLLEGWAEEWVLPPRQAREEAYLSALEKLAAGASGRNDQAATARYLRLAVAVDPLRETVQRALMETMAAAGEYAAATQLYRELRLRLHHEINAEPAPETTALYQQIRLQARERAEGGGIPKGEERKAKGETGQDRPVGIGSRLSPFALRPSPSELEPVGGAVPLDSRFYVARPADSEFSTAIARRNSIVLVKGTHQVGKTSLLARGLQQARENGRVVVLTNFEKLNAVHLESAEALLLALAQAIADQIESDVFPADQWDARRGPNANFERFLQREVLIKSAGPVVWGLDQVDRLFHYPYGGEILSLFRSWHNERALDPSGPWGKLTLAITYATEAQLFITDPNKSPFNVGTRLMLEDFSREQVADLNRRHGAPLKDTGDVARLYELVGGHPYLVRRALHELASYGTDLAALETRAPSEEWIFGDHLRHILALLERDAELREAAREVLRGQPCPTLASFYRLRSAGVISGEIESEARPRCRLYALYLERHLR